MSVAPPPPPSPARRRLPWLAAALGVAGVLGVMAWLQVWPNDARYQATFTTQDAERRTVTLPDGVTLALGPNTELSVKYEDTQRQLDIDTGQVFISLQPGESIPFAVQARDALVTATHAQFDVWHDAQGTRVAVASGTVQVTTRSLLHGIQHTLEANEVIEIEQDGRATPVLPMRVQRLPDGSLQVTPD